eukprot:767144-Hanusia_phi.AAC.3
MPRNTPLLEFGCDNEEIAMEVPIFRPVRLSLTLISHRTRTCSMRCESPIPTSDERSRGISPTRAMASRTCTCSRSGR